MKKLEKYSSFDELKENSTTGTASNAVLMERQKKFENFIHFLRGDSASEQAPVGKKVAQAR
ncbi:hypothetical protein [Dyadobacter sp. OTU695]|uniref:hypothetical protein n=1 Tax=Dyadobacter sp. OTU695 TaxID=3043860 RepID=UPI00313D3DBD